MRILVANDLYGRSSAAGVAVRMAEGLAGRGHEVAFLATTQERGGAGRRTEGGVDVRIVETPAYNQRWRAWRSLDNPAGSEAMAAAVDALRPDVVHVHNLHLHLGYASLARAGAHGAGVVLHVHDVMPFCHQKLFCHLDERLLPGDDVVYECGPVKCAVCVRGRYNPLRNRTVRRVVGRDVDRLVAVSDEMARALAHNGLGSATVVYNGLPPADPAPRTAVDALARRLGVEGRRTVLYGGRLDRLKGGLELVQALAVVRRAVPDATLLTVGEALPGFYDEMRALAARLGLPDDALVHTGWLTGEALAAAYALADVVATPSLCFESFGLINLEAMQAGKPVVASLWGGPSDVVVDGETGYLVNPLQVLTMADRLGRLLRDEALRRRLGEAGRRRAAEVFALDGQLDAVEALYEEMRR